MGPKRNAQARTNGSVLIEGFLIDQMDVGTRQIRSMDGQSPKQMPIVETGEGRGVVVLLQPLRQHRDGLFIKSVESILRHGSAGICFILPGGQRYIPFIGELAQLVERCDRTAEVRSSNLLFSIEDPSARMNWTSEAEQALKEVPFFVRPAVRKRIEAMARESERDPIDLSFYTEARARFGQS